MNEVNGTFSLIFTNGDLCSVWDSFQLRKTQKMNIKHPPSSIHLISEIEKKTLALGFAAVGFAVASKSESIGDYNKWLDDGFAGDMGYLRRHAGLKTHPEKVAEGVKTIIAVAARYPVNSDPGCGFSTYARGLDYHDVVRFKLRMLATHINDMQPLEVHRVCVDSAPLLEREWAMRAGIGWQGKQGQLISPAAGSCFVLGFLLVDIELEQSTPLKNQCGDCTLCIEACPTGAALGDGRVDARRCLSYLTIEPGAAVPPNLKQTMQGALFGCDCCTAVCPWNECATASVMPEFEELMPLPSSQEIMNWNEDDFKFRFKGTAVYRTGLEHLKRNAKHALAPLTSGN